MVVVGAAVVDVVGASVVVASVVGVVGTAVVSGTVVLERRMVVVVTGFWVVAVVRGIDVDGTVDLAVVTVGLIEDWDGVGFVTGEDDGVDIVDDEAGPGVACAQAPVAGRTASSSSGASSRKR